MNTTKKKAAHWLDDDADPRQRPDKPKKTRTVDISPQKKARLDMDPVKAVRNARLDRDRGLEPKPKKKTLDSTKVRKVRRAVDEDEAPVPKTRKELSRELVLPKKVNRNHLPAVMEKPATKRISKLNPKKMKSILGDSAEQIHQLLESDSNESAATLLQKRLIQSVLDLIPYAEHTIRKTKGGRGVYQFNSMITSIRELMIDVQATRDKGAIGDQLIEKILRPAFTDIATELMKEDQILGNLVKSHCTPDVHLLLEGAKHESLKRIAHIIMAKFDESKAKTIDFLRQ